MNEFKFYSQEHWRSLLPYAQYEIVGRLEQEMKRLGMPTNVWAVNFFESQRLVLIERAEQGTVKCVGDWIDSLP